jgi:hypothetical protein
LELRGPQRFLVHLEEKQIYNILKVDKREMVSR